MAPAKLRPMRCHLLGGGKAAEGEGGEEKEEEEEDGEELQAGEEAAERWKASDRSWVCMRTCSTMSSSVLGRPDQHSIGVAISTIQLNPKRSPKVPKQTKPNQ